MSKFDVKQAIEALGPLQSALEEAEQNYERALKVAVAAAREALATVEDIELGETSARVELYPGPSIFVRHSKNNGDSVGMKLHQVPRLIDWLQDIQARLEGKTHSAKEVGATSTIEQQEGAQ